MRPIGGFGYTEGLMCCNGVPLTEVIASVPHERGFTPLYVYNEKAILDNCASLNSAFPQAQKRFAVKACMNLEILRLIRDQGFGFDVVSHGELGRAKLAGACPGEIVYAGAAKTDYEISEAVGAEVTIVVERPEELPIIDVASTAQGLKTSALLRLRPNVDAHTHRHLTTGTAFSKFGMPEATVRSILREHMSNGCQFQGIHFHIGSQIESPDCTAQAIGVALPIIDEFGLQTLDIGGGFPVCYDEEGSAPCVGEFSREINNAIGDRDIQLLIEPGRSIVADTAVMVTTVMSVEYGMDEEGKPWRIVTCDAGMGDNPRPMLYDAYHQIWSLVAGDPELIPTYIAGPYCESTDFIGRGLTNLPTLRRGDRLVMMHCGAYVRAMASGYNGNLISPEIIVLSDGTIKLIAMRQSFGHSIALELVA